MKSWFEAFRLRTLPLAFSSILMGAFLAVRVNRFDWVILVLSLLTTLFLQVLSNLANDFGDSVSGVDGLQREGPSRAVQSGKISKESMKRSLFICGGLAFFSGIGLIIYAFYDELIFALIFLLIGCSSIVAAIKYTVGRSPYGYAGFGDLFVLIFFGIVGVGGTYFLFARSLPWMIFLPAISCGLFAVGVLNINNIRDITSDKEAGKFSIPVRVGRANAQRYHAVLLIFGLIAMAIYSAVNWSGPQDLTYVLTLPLFIINIRDVFSKEASELDPYLKKLAIATLLFVITFGLGTMI